MKRIGQLLIASVAAGGACVGGTAALAVATGMSPVEFVRTTPAAALRAISATAQGVTPNGEPTAFATAVAAMRGEAPGTYATSGASGASGQTLQYEQTAVRSGAPRTQGTSGASGAEVRTAGSATGVGANAATVSSRTHANSGASGAEPASTGAAAGAPGTAAKAPATQAKSGASGGGSAASAGGRGDDDRYDHEEREDEGREDHDDD